MIIKCNQKGKTPGIGSEITLVHSLRPGNTCQNGLTSVLISASPGLAFVWCQATS